MEELLKNKLGIEVLTDTGWSKFDGLIIKGTKDTVVIKTTKSTISCTLTHEFYLDTMNKTKASALTPGDRIFGRSGTHTVVSVTLSETKKVYDLLNVGKNRRFFANDMLVSNCEFIINDETLIAPIKLLDLEGREPLYKTGQVRWYKKPERNRIYVIALDPSLGTGGDPAAIQVFEANTTIQVAEWRHNQSDIPTQIRILNDIVQHIYDITQDDKSIYYSIENNTIGEAALISIAEWGEDRIKGYFLSDTRDAGNRRFRKGFNTTNKTKIAACAKLKNLIESGRMTINSRALVSELKTFVASGTAYAAKLGETDDLVMATIVITRMLQLLQSFHTELDSQIRDHGDSLIEPMPFISVSR